jgi:hypothetical protein
MAINGGWSSEGVADRHAHDAACKAVGEKLNKAAKLTDGHYFGCPYGNTYAGRVLPILSVASFRKDAGCLQVANALNSYLSIPAGAYNEIGCSRLGGMRISLGDFQDMVGGETAGLAAQLATCNSVASKINARFGLSCEPLGCSSSAMCEQQLTCGEGTEVDQDQCVVQNSAIVGVSSSSDGDDTTRVKCGGHGALTAAVVVLVVLVVFLVATIGYIMRTLGGVAASTTDSFGGRSISNPAFSRGSGTVRLGERLKPAKRRAGSEENFEELSM